ncbi:hypothetical protein FACS1894187_23230 [Synergistales bacterium]|nr:hypothetical protein FACS1894187_23230 [Synergistales bacterium]
MQYYVGSRVYPCERAARLADLELKPEESGDFMELDDNPKVMRANIKKFLSLDYIPSCDFCDFALNRKTKAAVQLGTDEVIL